MIRLLLVDDQPAVRRGLVMRLHMEPDIQIVGEAGTGREALSLAQELAPDVVLMDVEMPEMDGIEATAALTLAVSHSAVVILNIHGDAYTRKRAQAAGAVAFVEKPLARRPGKHKSLQAKEHCHVSRTFDRRGAGNELSRPAGPPVPASTV